MSLATLPAVSSLPVMGAVPATLPNVAFQQTKTQPATEIKTSDEIKFSASIGNSSKIPATAGLFDLSPIDASAGPRTHEDYEAIFKWVETVTGNPIAFKTKESRDAYIKAIQGKPQDAYDTKGFLAKIGVQGVDTYGRDDKGVHALLKTIEYTPESHEVSWPLKIAQKVFFWFFKAFPKTFDKIADLADKHYFTKKDTKDQSWLKVQVPQPGIDPKEPLISPQDMRQQYANNVISQSLAVARPRTTQEIFDGLFKLRPPKEISFLFEHDFHMGTPKPGENPQNYGTFAIAKRLGFTDDQAKNFATANYDMDLNNTAYGDTDAFPKAMPSKHFNLNKDKPENGDTRFIWAQRHLDAAVELAKRGRFKDAEREIGYGLHGIQDAFAHGHIRLTSHAITDNIPDGVDYNPVAAYEATLATIGYLNEYMKRLHEV